MRIVGGSYLETVVVPDSREWAGSGLRAAAALASKESRPKLDTALDDQSFEEVDLVRGALGVDWNPVPRTEPVGFRYVTPISSPSIDGPNSQLMEPISSSDDLVLAFGLMEAKGQLSGIEARVVVIDPQRPRDAEPLQLGGISAESIVIVANSSEVAGMGHGANLRQSAENILKQQPQVTGVVTKRGASGCLVTSRRGTSVTHSAVGAHATSRVWPIGSGDVFSAGLAHGLDIGMDLVGAAEVGSASAAHWCSTRVHALPREILDGDLSQIPQAIAPLTPTVYLAAPFFSLGERWLVEVVRQELSSLGVDVWSPVHEVGPGGDEVAQQDLDGLRRSDAVIALLDRNDPGTVFEVGWAVRHNIPVVGYATTADVEGIKMMSGTAVELHRDLSTACYRAAWAGMGMPTKRGWLT